MQKYKRSLTFRDLALPCRQGCVEKDALKSLFKVFKKVEPFGELEYTTNI